jgi:hypothetical protein
MNSIILLLFLIVGSVVMAYGLRIILKKSANVYRQGQTRQYEGQAAQLVGIGTAFAGLGMTLIGLGGWGMLLFGLIGATLYFVMVNLADRR